MQSLKKHFYAILTQRNISQKQSKKTWKALKKHHQNRAYHNFSHLYFMYKALSPLLDGLKPKSREVLIYALLYHDSIYNIHQKDNEAQSAILAQKKLQALSIPEKTIKQTKKLILATASHQKHTQASINLFTDADLSILAVKKKTYKKYLQAIREEYNFYEDKDFYQGRIKVIQHFLKQQSIYKSKYFYQKYEDKARKNLRDELKSLSKLF